MKFYSLLASAFMLCSFAVNGQTVIASQDFDNPVNMISETLTPSMPFSSLADIWGVTNANTGAPDNAPFVLIDDSDPTCPNPFPNDTQGAVPCSYPGNFLAAADTQNGNNPMGTVSGVWEFDISDASGLANIQIDMAAMGNFEMLPSGTDDFVWSYSIDGAPFATIFDLDVPMAGPHSYTMADGDIVTLIDPFVLNGVVVDNNFQTFTAAINGSGNTLTLRVDGITNGGGEAVAFDNIVINGLAATGSAIPTMSQWATFLFALIMVSFGLVFVYKSQTRLALAEGLSVSANNQTIPFDKGTFQSALKIAMLLTVPGFAFIFMVWGEIVSADFIGMALAIPVLAYFIHMVKLFGKK